ncbi:hypothetical protein GCM10010269_13020 [Streptomyces humidus]|uniref:Uncharacterized protein n=1 Tax=Streptomyces humidus TaxID=52259 RepID=A0A918L1L3_9ACTN|nr:hypothetical protein [Streptomyces humidus]GGR75211.1 hypothetical protein GCM10010269_13020 [Streptomyces humidus]
MGKRVLAAFGVVAPMEGVLVSGLSAAPASADAVTSSTAERTGSSEEARSRVLRVAWPQTGAPPQERSAPGRRQAVPEPAAVQGRAGARSRARTDVAPPAGRRGIFDHATMNPLGPAGS